MSEGERNTGKFTALVKNFAFSITLVFLVLVLIEGTLRIAGISAIEREIPFQPHETFGWIYRPHYHGFWHGAQVSINSLGIRNGEISPEKETGTYRILCLGNSVTFGYGTENDKTYVRVLETLLRERRPGPKFETINAGIGGFSTLQEWLFLKNIGVAFDPDLVTVAFVLNDVLDMSTAQKRIDRAKRQKGVKESAEANEASFYGRFRRTAMYHLFTLLMAHYKKWEEARNVKNLVAVQYPSEEIERNWEQVQTHLSEITDLAAKNGFRVLLVVLPFRFQIEEDDPIRIPQDRLIDLGNQIGMPVLDLLPVFRENRDSDLFLDTNHPTETGHRLVAEEIYEYMEKTGILP